MPHKEVTGCPRCGNVARIGFTLCPVCRRQGHLSVMATADELTRAAARNALDGDERYRVAKKHMATADAVRGWTDKDD